RHAREVGVAQVGLLDEGAAEPGACGDLVHEAGVGEIRALRPALGALQPQRLGEREPAHAQVALAEAGFLELRTVEAAAGLGLRIVEDAVHELGTGQVGAGEIAVAEMRVRDPGAGEALPVNAFVADDRRRRGGCGAHRRSHAEASASTPTPPVIHDHSGTAASSGPPACSPYSSADTTTRPTPVTAVTTRRCSRFKVLSRLTMSCERIASSCLPSTCWRSQLCSRAGMSGAWVMISGRRLPSSLSARRGLYRSRRMRSSTGLASSQISSCGSSWRPTPSMFSSVFCSRISCGCKVSW